MKAIKIDSGGQTGADRAALDWAVEHNLECGGWCPKGRKAESTSGPFMNHQDRAIRPAFSSGSPLINR